MWCVVSLAQVVQSRAIQSTAAEHPRLRCVAGRAATGDVGAGSRSRQEAAPAVTSGQGLHVTRCTSEAGGFGGLSDVHTFATFSPHAYHNSFISPTHPGFILVSSSADDRPWCRGVGHQAVTGVPEPPGTQHVGQDAQTAPTTASCPAVDRRLRRLSWSSHRAVAEWGAVMMAGLVD